MSDQHTTFQDPTCRPIYTHRHAQTLSLTRHANMRNIFSETRGIGHSPFKDLEVKPRLPKWTETYLIKFVLESSVNRSTYNDLQQFAANNTTQTLHWVSLGHCELSH